jgi:hypothetical protein
MKQRSTSEYCVNYQRGHVDRPFGLVASQLEAACILFILDQGQAMGVGEELTQCVAQMNSRLRGSWSLQPMFE